MTSVAPSEPIAPSPAWPYHRAHLADVDPFHDIDAPGFRSLDIDEMLERRRARGLPVALEPASLVAFAGRNHLVGDRALFQGIRRTPWMAAPGEGGEGQWPPLPPHARERPVPDTFAERLKAALLAEVEGHVAGARTVGLLLSGGADSRLVAGLLRETQLAADGAFDVIALTWGRSDSRDVHYAAQVAQRLGWEWRHFPLDAEVLRANLDAAALTGGEVSPLHLHALPRMAALEGLDGITAATYGDSVGRGAFSAGRVTRLRPMRSGAPDRFGILRTAAVAAAALSIDQTLTQSATRAGTTGGLRLAEVQQNQHRLRRVLQCAMQVAAREKPLHQLFTDPAVFGLLWRLDPRLRDGRWYRALFRRLPGRLLTIPLASGADLSAPAVSGDGLAATHHDYGRWLRRDLRPLIESRVTSDAIRALGVFNDGALDRVLTAWRQATTTSTNALDDLVVWLAALEPFLRDRDIAPPEAFEPPAFPDRWRALRGAGRRTSLYPCEKPAAGFTGSGILKAAKS